MLRLMSELMVVLLLLPFYSRNTSPSTENDRIIRIESSDKNDGDNMDVSYHSKIESERYP